MTFVRHVKFNFSIIVSLESITVNETKECVSRYTICSEQARRTVKRIAYLWSRCSTEDRLSSFSRLVHTSARCSSDHCIYLRYSHTDFLCTTNIKHAFQSSRKIFCTRYALKSDFSPLCIKRIA